MEVNLDNNNEINNLNMVGNVNIASKSSKRKQMMEDFFAGKN